MREDTLAEAQACSQSGNPLRAVIPYPIESARILWRSVFGELNVTADTTELL